MSPLAARTTHVIARLYPREGLSTDLLLLILALMTAGTVAASHWVRGSEAVVGSAVIGLVVAILLARLAPRGTTFWLATEVGMIAMAFFATAHHTNAPAHDFSAWVIAVEHDGSLLLLVAMVAAAWLAVAWTAYWALRRDQVPAALAPLAAAMVVEVIDDPGLKGINYRVVVWMALAGVLLMRHTVARLGSRWGGDRAPGVSSGVGVQGGWALALILVAAFFLIPPLSTVDLSGQYFAGTSASGGGPGGRPGTQKSGAGDSFFALTGYSERVAPGGTLIRSLSPVMQVITDLSVPVYWRGIDLYALRNGSWDAEGLSGGSVGAGPNQDVATGTYLARQTVHATIRVLGVTQSTIFWPGDPVRAGIGSQVRGLPASGAGQGVGVASVDAAYSRNPLPPGSTYTVEANYSTASEAQLRAAGTSYPAAVSLLTSQGSGRGGGSIDPRIAALARQVAGAKSNPYDQVKAVETYLRSTLRYSLDVGLPPGDQDPVAYFLFASHVGYCEYFASAMGEMVRSLGIPVRLVGGYGPGAAQTTQVGPGRHETIPGGPSLIRASDAHTWVEAFFPNYGWIPFEPTPDPLYPALDRSLFDAAPQAAPALVPVPGADRANLQAGAARPSGLLPGLVLAAVLIVVLAMVLVFAVLVARGPARLRTPEAAWRRLGWLAARLGQPRRPTDTPVEFTGRLARAMPSLGRPITDIGHAYSQWCYRRDGVADLQGRRAEEAWRSLRRAIVRELLWPRQAAAEPR